MPSGITSKPKLRGWLHAGMAPVALAAGVVLIALAPDDGKAACAVYALTGVLLFTVSAAYHLGDWSPGVGLLLKRLDHTNIVLVIAGTYTPLAWALLDAGQAVVLLWIIWSAAVLGVLFRILWVAAPRWLYVPVYIGLGLAALVYLPEFAAVVPAAAVLVCVGGAFYIAGALFYAFRRPNFSAAWFGFHELFHAFTLVGFAAHYAAILLAVLAVRS